LYSEVNLEPTRVVLLKRDTDRHEASRGLSACDSRAILRILCPYYS